MHYRIGLCDKILFCLRNILEAKRQSGNKVDSLIFRMNEIKSYIEFFRPYEDDVDYCDYRFNFDDEDHLSESELNIKI